LGESAGVAEIDGLRVWTRLLADERYYLVSQFAPQVKVFDKHGAYWRTIGRRGEGPGEFMLITALDVDPPGTYLAVYDAALSRRTILDLAHDSVLSTFRLAVAPEPMPILLDNGAVLVNRLLATREGVGYPLHLLGADGQLIRSFGSTDGEFDPTQPFPIRRVMTKARTGDAIWIVRPSRYALELWNLEGDLLRVVERDAAWFESGYAGHTDADEPPPPIVMGMQEDSAGLLWVFLGVADPEWRGSVTASSPDGTHRTIDDLSGFRDTIVEVLDPSRARVVATGRFAEYLDAGVGHGMAGAAVLSDDSTPRYVVWDLSYSTPHGR
jgi:hypothetical protein